MSEDSNDLNKSDDKNRQQRPINHKLKKCISDYNLISGINSKQTQKVRDYELIKEIGRGAYGTVHLARKEDSQNVVAIKVLDKLFLSKQEGKIEEALIERDVLSMCNHPSIIKILSSFQTTNKLFYVLEYAPNKDLDYLLRKFGILPEALAKFYAAEILNTLEYLHKKKSISHNDLKPGNIMLDDHYHLKFIDFSTAKIDGKKYDSKSKKFVDSKLIVNDVVGTAEYCSPEMANMQLTDYKTNDIWAFGCIIYHFYHGRTPFKGGNDFQTFANVRTGKYSINQTLSSDLKDLISNILVLDTKNRLGCKEEGVTELKSHPYFHGVDWENITKAQVPLPVDLLKKLSSKLQSNDNGSEFWANICSEINSKTKNEYEIEQFGTYFILEDYYYNEKDNVNRLFTSEGIKDSTLVYEGIVTRVGMINMLMKLRLTTNKKIQCYNNKKNAFEYEIPLNKTLQVSIENESILKLNTGKFQYIFQTTKLEAIKWYNFINQTVFSE